MLYRKFTHRIEQFLREEPRKILLVNGARQVGKSFLIRHVGKKMFKNYVEINLKADQEGVQIFEHVRTIDDFYLQLGIIAGSRLGSMEDTLVFLDEIQCYPHLLTMLKFLNQDGRYRYIASGSQLGVALAESTSVPIGSISIEQMYPLDFEEFLMACGCGKNALGEVKKKFLNREGLNENLHEYFMKQFRLYLIIGGMPEAVKKFVETQNVVLVRRVQRDILKLYRIDASQYDADRRLVIRRIYDMIPSYMENRKKRIVVKDIEETKGHKQFDDYASEFEYLTNSGVALSVQAVSNPTFPLIASQCKNLLKLYMNDVGLLTCLLYDKNVNAILEDERSVNLGSVYETVVAQELHANGLSLYYYDNKQKGEVDYLVDDYEGLAILPIEVKSGKDYTVHSALNNFLKTPDYNVKDAIVLCNNKEVYQKSGITYLPVYYVMFLACANANVEDTKLEIPSINN